MWHFVTLVPNGGLLKPPLLTVELLRICKEVIAHWKLKDVSNIIARTQSEVKGAGIESSYPLVKFRT